MKRKGWKSKLTKKELQHVKDTTSNCLLSQFRINIEGQKGGGIVCFECRSIARKLGIEVTA